MKVFKLCIILITVTVLSGCASKVTHTRKSADFIEKLDNINVLLLQKKNIIISFSGRRGLKVSESDRQSAREDISKLVKKFNNGIKETLSTGFSKNNVKILNFEIISDNARAKLKSIKENTLLIFYDGSVLCKHFICHNTLTVYSSLYIPNTRRSVWTMISKLSNVGDESQNIEVTSFVDNVVSQMKSDNMFNVN